MKVVIITGGFDPIHSGHFEYMICAKALGDVLVVGLNSDKWLERKKGQAFLPYYEREQVLLNTKSVDNVIGFDDDDDSAIDAILKVQHFYPNAEIIFANGGDRNKKNIPEIDMFKGTNVQFVFGVGGSKRNSSSAILEKWTNTHTERPWGYYKVLHNEMNIVKVKELVVMPGKRLSMQRHENRSEHWFISKGTAMVYTLNTGTDVELRGEYVKFDNLHIAKGEWHQLANESESPLRIVEIQYGESCSEDDIQRNNWDFKQI